LVEVAENQQTPSDYTPLLTEAVKRCVNMMSRIWWLTHLVVF